MRSSRSPFRRAVRVDGYVRVSTVRKRRGARFISPTVQREAIQEWVRRQGFTLSDVLEELDESGARADRPLLQRAIERIEAGASDGLVVWRVDRFGRSLSDGLHIIERIRAAGGGFYSVHDGLDVDTEAGRLALRILLSVAEFQLEGIRAGWDAAREHAIRRGMYLSHSVPVGYRKTRAGRLRPDPRTGPIMAEVYRRRAAGDSLLTLSRYLQDNNVLTGKGNRFWSSSAVSQILRSRVYLGEVRSGPYVHPNAHSPLTDPPTWQAARHPRILRRHETQPALLVAGLARCAGCSHSLKPFMARPSGRTPYLNYGCRKYHAAGVCPAPAMIVASKLEPYVVEASLEILRRRRRAPAERLAAAERNAQDAEHALDRYRDNDTIARVIGDTAFLAGLAVRQERLREARLQVIDARAAARLHELPSVPELRAQLTMMSLEQQRELVRKVVDVVFVGAGRRSAAERVTVCPAGTAPRLLPRQGDRGRVLQTIAPRRGWINATPLGNTSHAPPTQRHVR